MKKLFFETLSSTNLYLKENYNSLYDLTLVYTNHQTEGRGRLGRTWVDNDDLLFSILIKNNLTNPTDYTFLIALTVLNVLKQLGLKPLIKWPNDLIVNKKKISGILLESISTDKIEALIIGVGINVNTTMFPKELFFKATSLKKELKKDIDKEELLNMIIDEFTNTYNNYKNKKFNLMNEVRSNLYLVDSIVKFTYQEQELVGKIEGLDNEGRLLINNRGEILHLTSGEISLHNEY